MSSAVRLAAWMAAIRATATTSPFGRSPDTTRAAVSGVMRTTARARAQRSLGALPPTSTMRAVPSASRWVSDGSTVRKSRLARAMQLTVRLFAGLRERAGASTLAVDVPDPGTVADLLAALEGTPVGGMPRRSFIVAVNREYAGEDVAVRAGDEVALIPPVSGGAPEDDRVRAARITAQPLDVGALSALVRDARAGAVVCFEGVTREVERLEYEAYAEMAEPRLRAIAAEEAERHGLCAVAVEHRIGSVPLSEPSVIVAASAPHRGEAFAGARAVIDRVKAEAPIWKKEIEGGGERWVEGTLPPA